MLFLDKTDLALTYFFGDPAYIFRQLIVIYFEINKDLRFLIIETLVFINQTAGNRLLYLFGIKWKQ